MLEVGDEVLSADTLHDELRRFAQIYFQIPIHVVRQTCMAKQSLRVYTTTPAATFFARLEQVLVWPQHDRDGFRKHLFLLTFLI